MSPQKRNTVWSGPILIDWLTIISVLAVAAIYLFAFALSADTAVVRLGIAFLALIPLELMARSKVIRIRLLLYLCDEHGYEQGYTLWQLFRGLYVVSELVFVSYIFSNNTPISQMPTPALVLLAGIIGGQLLLRIGILWAKFQRFALLDINFNPIGDSSHGELYLVDVWETYGFLAVRGPWDIDTRFGHIRYRTSFQPDLHPRTAAPYQVLYLPK